MGNRTKDTSCQDCGALDIASMCPMTADERWSRKRKREDHEEPSGGDVVTQVKILESILDISHRKLAQMAEDERRLKYSAYQMRHQVLMMQTCLQTVKRLEELQALQVLKRPHVPSSQNWDHQYSLTPGTLKPSAPLTPAAPEPMDVDDASYHPHMNRPSSINRPPTPASFQFGGLGATGSSIMGVPQDELYTLPNNMCTPVSDPCPEPEEDPTKSFINLSSVPGPEIPEFFWDMTYSDFRGDSPSSSAPASPGSVPVPSSSGTASPAPETASPPLRIPFIDLASSQSSELSEVCQTFEENGVPAHEFFNKILPRLVDFLPDDICDNSSSENLNSSQNQGNCNQAPDNWNQISPDLTDPSSWEAPLQHTQATLLHTEDVFSLLQAVESGPNSEVTSIGTGFEDLHISEPL